MHKHKIFLLLFIILIAPSLEAQLFWKISGNGVANKSYLFGTHHLIEKGKISHFDDILKTVKQVEVVVGEMDMSNMLGMQMKMLQGAMMKDKTIKDLLNDEDYLLVDNALKETVGTGLAKLGKMKPMMLSSMYSVMLYLKHHQLKKQPEAVDLIFQKTGKKYKKKIVGLETIEQQMDILFNSIPLERQAEMLVEAVKEKDKSLETLDQLNSAYVVGDLTLLETLYLEDDGMTPEENLLLLEQRNDMWILQLSEMLPKTSCFIAVGCMHLVGEKGLINQLRKRGFIVEEVRF